MRAVTTFSFTIVDLWKIFFSVWIPLLGKQQDRCSVFTMSCNKCQSPNEKLKAYVWLHWKDQASRWHTTLPFFPSSVSVSCCNLTV